MSTVDNVDLSKTTIISCESCSGKTFKQTMLIRKMSAIVSPTGQEAIVPVAAFCCEQCGHINKEFQDAEISGV